MNEEKKLESIYKQYVKNVYRYSMFKLNDREEAEDVTSETFARFIENTQSREIPNIESWLIGIARNVIYEKYRNASKFVDTNEEGLLIENYSDEDASLEDQVLNDAMVNEIKETMIRLNEDSQEILVLRIWEDMKFKNIAEIFNEKESTIKKKYYRSLAELKLKMSKKHTGKKYYTFNLPLLIEGIGQVKNLQEFAIPDKLLKTLIVGYGAEMSLIIKSLAMTTVNEIPGAGLGGVLSTASTKIITALLGIGVITTASIGGYVVYEDTIKEEKHEQVVKEVDRVEEYRELEEVKPVSQPKECKSATLKTSIIYSDGWNCKVADHLIQLTKDKYTLTVSDLGRGGPCDGSWSEDPTQPIKCKSEFFYSNSVISSKQVIESGKLLEIYVSFVISRKTADGNVWASLSFSDSGNWTMTEADKVEIIKLFEGLK